MPTVVGIVTFFAGAYLFTYKQECLLGALMVVSVFEASSAVNIGERGIQPYYILAGFIILRGMLNRFSKTSSQKSMPGGNWLLAFACIGVLSAFVLPIVFAGTPVYDAKVGIDLGFFVRPPLHLGLNNVGQAIFLAWHVATAYALLYVRYSWEKTRKAYLWAFYILVSFVFGQALFQFAGVPFPDGMIRNNPGYAITDSTFGAYGIRNSGTFTEPSVAGAFLLFFCVGFAKQYLEGKGSILRVLIALATSSAVASSGSIAALAVFLFLLLVSYAPFRLPWHFVVSRAKRPMLLFGVLVTPLALLLIAPSSLKDLLASLTLGKSDSSSFINRTASDLYALELLVQSHMLGVGLGSNRSSSLLPNMLSNVGLMGSLVFCVFCVRLLFKLPSEYSWLRWACFALLFNMCIGVPDITLPILWNVLFLASQVAVQERGQSEVSWETGKPEIKPVSLASAGRRLSKPVIPA